MDLDFAERHDRQVGVRFVPPYRIMWGAACIAEPLMCRAASRNNRSQPFKDSEENRRPALFIFACAYVAASKSAKKPRTGLPRPDTAEPSNCAAFDSFQFPMFAVPRTHDDSP